MTIIGTEEQRRKMPGLYKSLDQSLAYSGKEDNAQDKTPNREFVKWKNLYSGLEESLS